MTTLQNKKMVIIGGGSGIARQLANDAESAGAQVISVGRPELDLADEATIAALAARVGELDYLVTLAADPANGPVTALDRDAVHRAFDAKVIGPLLLAKHFADRFRPGGAMLLFSGVVAWRPAPGRTVMAAANAAASTLAAAGRPAGPDQPVPDRHHPARRRGRPLGVKTGALRRE
ncbi:SDR family oxidoreductase [Nocardia sp. JMUB6875]|uniref:SDR family oxidoreductase n=1 Tax=Nocardia sp. JMUB6875 TaxID=3158170 RepID=UPI0032E7B55E